MLVNNQNSVDGKILGFRMSTGEEFVTKVDKEKMDSYDVSKPLTIVSDGKGGVGFHPAIIMADTEKPVTLYKNCIMSTFEVKAELEHAYESHTTGIAMPHKSIIT